MIADVVTTHTKVVQQSTRTVERRGVGHLGFELLASDERNGEIGEIGRATLSVSAGPFIEHRARRGVSRGGSGGVHRS